MPLSLTTGGIQYADVNREEDDDNPVVSIDLHGNVLSRLKDKVWIFAVSKTRPKSRYSIHWPDGSENEVIQAKRLAFLCLTRGKRIGAASAYSKCLLIASLAAFCAVHGIAITSLSRHPKVLIEFARSKRNAAHKNNLIAVARLALSFRDTLGWTLLHADQIAHIEAIRTLESNRFPVIPHRIYGELDNAANTVLTGYLEVAEQLDEICAIRAQSSEKARLTKASWKRLLPEHPVLAAEVMRWGGNAVNPISSYIYTVRVAACWVIAAGSCARRSEILSLRRGCLSYEMVGANMAYLLKATTTKTQDNPNAIWIVSPTVGNAIQALERLLQWYERSHPAPPNMTDYLFQVLDFTFGRHLAPTQARKGKLQFGSPLRSIVFDSLMSEADIRITDADWAEAKRLTPSLDEKKFAVGMNWVPSVHQLRRTVLVYAAASGLVSQDSLSFQAKHETYRMTAYYTEYYWELLRSEPDHPLVEGTRRSDAEEFGRAFADSYNQARLSALESDRFFSPYGPDHKQSLIRSVPILTLDEIRTGLARAVLKRNTLGLCAQSEFCEWQKAITVRGCITKGDGAVCPKAVIDADQEKELRALRQDLTYQLESIHARDTFAREQIEADIAAADNAIQMIKKHNGEGRAEA